MYLYLLVLINSNVYTLLSSLHPPLVFSFPLIQFFDAIRFVFGDAMGDSLRADNKASLLHESSEIVLQGYVEVVLDNSDGRLPIDSDEVTLRRAVGLKKDEYFMNLKRVQKGDFTNVLESGGFSKSNPYYIVAQGRVDALTKMTESQRLQVLKDVAGTQVFDEKRKDSLGLLLDSDEKRVKIADNIRNIDDRINELEVEREKLSEFLSIERDKHALEYCLYTLEEAKAAESLSELEAEHKADMAAADEAAAQALVAAGGSTSGQEEAKGIIKKRVSILEAEIASLTAQVTAMKSALKEAEALKKECTTQLPSLTARKVKCAGALSRIDAEVSREKSSAEEAKKELKGVEEAIVAKQNELETKLIPVHSDALKLYEMAANDAAAVRSKYDALLDKAGRSGQFKSKKERDAYLTTLINDARASITKVQDRLSSAEKDAATAAEKCKKLGEDAAKIEAFAKKAAAEEEALASQLDAMTEKRRTAISAAHDAKRALDAVEKRVAELTTQGDEFERAVYHSMPQALRRGLEECVALSDPSNPHHIAGIHGPLFDLFKPTKPLYNTAIEAVAGPDLFNVVVDDEAVASQVIKHLAEKKAGRVTLVPLSRIKDVSVTYPTTDDSRPLIKFLEYDPKLARAVQQTFSRALLCRTTAAAMGYSRSHDLTCVTLEGDIANKRGALQGGYVDPRTAKIASIAGMYNAQGLCSDAKDEKKKLEALVAETEAVATRLQTQLLEADNNRRRLRDDYQRLLQDLERCKSDISSSSWQKESSTREAALATQQLTGMQAKLDRFQKELGTELNSTLSAAETAEMETLSREIEGLSKRVKDAQVKLDEAHRAKSSMESQLNDNLLRRAKELSDRISTVSTTTSGGRITTSTALEALRLARRDLEDAETAEKDLKAALESSTKDVDDKSAKLSDLQDKLGRVRTEVATLGEHVAEETLREEKYFEKRRMLQKEREDAKTKIRDLGAIPTAEADKIKDKSRKQLAKLLAEATSKLAKFTHVNKQAENQFEKYSRMREELLDRQKEVERGNESIRSLIQTLDLKKDEKISTTFKQVQKHFREVFAALVPKGSATLVMKTSMDGAEDDEEESTEFAAKTTSKAGKRRSAEATAIAVKEAEASSYRGLGIRVSFTDQGESKDVRLLSGGQKSLVALALIFSIQKVDPAPFYVFDEIDSALDSIHRAAVGALIKKQAFDDDSPAQFIVSTFSPEIVDFADRFFGVELLRKVSSIAPQSKEETLAFLHSVNAGTSGEADEGTARPSTSKKPKRAEKNE
jgi:structural maintenance of chromosome 3 (chondroitin sulfate proteoglycan 6)